MQKQIIKADVPETGGPFNLCVRHGDMLYVSGLPPFDPETGDIKPVPFARQAELIMAQMKHCLESAGTSLDGVLKCNVYCVPGEGRFQTFNEIYGRYFPDTSPARIFMHVHSWPGPFDVEIDCVAVR